MMIIMQEGATEEQIAHVVARIEEVGASAHVSMGERVAVIGAIGDREELAGAPLEACAGVDRVVAILKPYKLVGREFHPHDTIVDVRGRKLGGQHFAIIAGPCSVETEEQVMAAARAVAAAGRLHAARRGVQAAFVAVCLPGSRRRGAQAAGRGSRRDRSADRHRASRPARPRGPARATPTSCRSAPATCRTSSSSPRSDAPTSRCCSSAACRPRSKSG